MSFASIQDVTYFSLAGFTLTTEEQSVLAASLHAKKDQEKVSSISFWGKIIGINHDYIIAQATGKTLFDRKFYYSPDLISWLQLPEISQAEAKRIDRINSRFSGDPSFEYTLTTEVGEVELKPEEKIIKEDKRVAHVVSVINNECQIVPRGAYYRNATANIELNPNFHGLAKDGFTNLKNYLHFKKGYEIDEKTLAENIHNFDSSIDIFGAIDKDEPLGCWSIQSERGGSVAILRNLFWPGYVFYHSPSANKFGGVYQGTGQKNNHLGYMI